MADSMLMLLGALFLVSSLCVLLASKTRRTIILNRLPLRKRSLTSRTPPQSISWSKEHSEPDYSDVYPPSRRFVLAECAPYVLSESKDASDSLRPLAGEKKPIQAPIDLPYEKWDPKALTPCGFSKEEIELLGDWPDYAALSGVPLPNAYEGFDITKAKARPYRPFRWAYHQTMSLAKMETDWWLELESTYVERIKQRQELYRSEGKGVLQALPGSELACKELMEMCLQFLCARYPMYFSIDMAQMKFFNRILNTTTYLKTAEPLVVLLDNVPEDFALMLRNPDTGYYEFRAGVICSALGWNLASKMGMRLHEIHEPIPDYKEKMQMSMDRYFTKKPTDKPIQRGSWGLEVDQPLYMPPGSPHEAHRLSQSPQLSLAQCHLRVDWQTLRRLPLSGAVAFNYKALFTPVTAFRDEAYIPSLVLKVLTEGKQSILKYKSTWHTEHVVIPVLREFEKEQRERGLVNKEWEIRTLDESPFFPGWEAKWRDEQGF